MRGMHIVHAHDNNHDYGYSIKKSFKKMIVENAPADQGQSLNVRSEVRGMNVESEVTEGVKKRNLLI